MKPLHTIIATILSLHASLMYADDEEGFAPLFDGQTLNGWTGARDGYAVQDGVVVAIPGKGGNLYTEKDFSDFILRFDFRLTPGANNGIGLRVPEGGRASYQGMEIQILDSTAKKYARLNPYQFHGSVYGVLPAKRGYLKQVGAWNEHEIRCVGREIRITLNGEVIVDGNLDEAATPHTLDGKDHPGLSNTSGRISLCGHRTEVHFRNMRIKDLATDE